MGDNGEGNWKIKVASAVVGSRPKLLIVFGVALIVLGLAGGITYHNLLQLSGPTAQIGSVALGIILVLLGLFRREPPSDGPSLIGDCKEYGIEIDHPRPGARVDITEVRGTIAKPLPEGYELRILRIYPKTNNFVPIGSPRPDGKEGRWIAEQCNIGGTSGDDRGIAVCIVGRAGAILLDYFDEASRVHNKLLNAKTAPGEEKIYLPLLSKRPPDMIECHRVNVQRI